MCKVICRRMGACKSFNFCERTKRCTFFPKPIESYGGQQVLRSRTGIRYYSFICGRPHRGGKGKACGNQRCHEKASCIDDKCHCKTGYSGDGIRACRKKCTCSVFGDPHYRTYDGQLINFHGACRYTLSKSLTKDACSFNIEVSNERNLQSKEASYTREVDIEIAGHRIKLMKGPKVLYNGVKRNIPMLKKGVQIVNFGRFVKVKTHCGVTVSWDGSSSAIVEVPPRYRRSMTGLCGNCDGRKNDYVTRDGRDVTNKRSRDAMIGNSYLVMSRADKSRLGGRKCEAVEAKPHCSDEAESWVRGRTSCGMVLRSDGPFRECIEKGNIKPDESFGSCRMDVCQSWKNPADREKVMCKAIESLADLCEQRGYKVKWRSNAICPLQCPGNSHYSASVSACPNTCSTPDSERHCKDAPREGCRCNRGFVRSDRKCVPVSKCGCADAKGNYFKAGETWFDRKCADLYKCVNVDKPRILHAFGGQSCHFNGYCGTKNGKRQCLCKVGFTGDGVTGCKPTARKPTCLNGDGGSRANERCSAAGDRGDCDNDPLGMSNCRRTCNWCDDKCRDRTGKCEKYRAEGYCETSPDKMNVICKKTCALCESTKPAPCAGGGDK